MRFIIVVLSAIALFGGGGASDTDDKPPPEYPAQTVEFKQTNIKRKEAPAIAKDKGGDIRHVSMDDNRAAETNGDMAENKAELIEVEATFYTARCEGCSGITRTGVDVRKTVWHAGKRIIAVDPNVIPLDSVVHVRLENGQEFEATAQDIGGAIKGRRIDVLVETKSDARRLGRQAAEVEIIERGGD